MSLSLSLSPLVSNSLPTLPPPTLLSGVRSFALDHTGTYLAAVTLDGTALIHRLLWEQGPLRRQYTAYNMECVKNSAVSKELCR